MDVTITTYEEGGVITSETRECSPEIEKAINALREAYVGFPWCRCDPQPDADRWTYFENEHGVSHGWKCLDCGGVTQVG